MHIDRLRLSPTLTAEQVHRLGLAEVERIRALQRASAGLIISEATNISPQGKGYIRTPGIWSKEQVEGWKLVTAAVHARGGKIFLQLWHVGRISHSLLQEGGQGWIGIEIGLVDHQLHRGEL